MSRKIKCILLVVVFLALALDKTEAAKKNKKSITNPKHKEHQEKAGKEMPKEVKLEGRVQEGKKLRKEFQSAEKTKLGEAKENRWKEKVQKEFESAEKKPFGEAKERRGKEKVQKDGAKGKQQLGGGKPQHGQHVKMNKKDKISDRPKKNEQIRCGPSEEFLEENLPREEKPKQFTVEENESQIWEEEEYAEEMEEDILETEDECLDCKSRSKTLRNCATKTKETILIQEDVDGKCYYEL